MGSYYQYPTAYSRAMNPRDPDNPFAPPKPFRPTLDFCTLPRIRLRDVGLLVSTPTTTVVQEIRSYLTTNGAISEQDSKQYGHETTFPSDISVLVTRRSLRQEIMRYNFRHFADFRASENSCLQLVGVWPEDNAHMPPSMQSNTPFFMVFMGTKAFEELPLDERYPAVFHDFGPDADV